MKPSHYSFVIVIKRHRQWKHSTRLIESLDSRDPNKEKRSNAGKYCNWTTSWFGGNAQCGHTGYRYYLLRTSASWLQPNHHGRQQHSSASWTMLITRGLLRIYFACLLSRRLNTTFKQPPTPSTYPTIIFQPQLKRNLCLEQNRVRRIKYCRG